MSDINGLIRSRRSVFPANYIDRLIEEATILEILENANWAPSHKKTEPWRFKIFHTLEARTKLSEYLSLAYKEHTQSDKFSELQHSKISEKPIQAGCAIAICMQRDLAASVPEWEEIAAVACAVQNIWLTCTDKGIGAYWASPSFFLKADEFLGLADGERCLGLFYMGYQNDKPLPDGTRKSLEDKISWF
jgi:nitroreductase